jgi:hypothetical protein
MDGGVADTARANTTVLTQAVNRRSLWGKRGRHPSFSARTAPVFPRLYISSTNRAAVGGGYGSRCAYARTPRRCNPREQQQLDLSLVRPPYAPRDPRAPSAYRVAPRTRSSARALEKLPLPLPNLLLCGA